jgi:hypothetical protein
MRKLMIMILPLSTTIIASCGPQKLALPSDPIDRAATCAVVSAAASRASAPTVAGGLGFDQQTQIIHYAMLAGTDDQGLSTKRTAAVVARMNDLQPRITDGKWQKLAAPCDSAYPEVKKTSGIALPASKFDAELGCYAMGDFLTRAVQTTDSKGEERLAIYNKLHRDLDGPIGAGLKARGASMVAKTQALKDVALGRMTRLGAPSQVMKICTDRFV